ncbi:MAG TPA: dodecin family protein, partial [Propionibacteriaceae bacterium]|nr:dodecin family protein [Propionibacteriaceae bacterium]
TPDFNRSPGFRRNTGIPSRVAQELDGDSWNYPIHSDSKEVIVPGTVARVTEISARSDIGFEDAVKVGLDRANATLRGVTSAWVKEQSVDVRDGNVVAYRVNLLVTFVLE